MNRHVMISYNQSSAGFLARKLNVKLLENNFITWIDYEKMEGNVFSSMAEAIENSFVVLVLITDEYCASKNCNDECSYAEQQNKPIIPIKVNSKCNPRKTNGSVGFIVHKLKYEDFSDSTKFDDNFASLLIRIRKFQQNFENSNLPQTINQFKFKTIEQAIAFNIHLEEDINRIIHNFHSIDVGIAMSSLGNVNNLLKLAYACTIGCPSEKYIVDMFSKYQTMIKNSCTTLASSAEACVLALNKHQESIIVLNKNEYDTSLHLIVECSNIASIMETKFGKLVNETKDIIDSLEKSMIIALDTQMKEEEKVKASGGMRALKSLNVAIYSLELAIKALGKSKSLFEIYRQIWLGVERHCKHSSYIDFLKELNRIEELKDEYIHELNLSSLNWVSLGKIIHSVQQPINKVAQETDNILSKLPTKSEALLIIQNEADIILKSLQDEKSLLDSK